MASPNLGSTLSQSDIYPLSSVLAPGAQPPDSQQASGKSPSGATGDPGVTAVGIIVGLVLLRVAYEMAGN